MQILNDEKYDYRDVLIRPKRNALKSRADVSLQRNFKFSHGESWSGFPLIAANMDTIGTFSMARALLQENSLTSIQKFYPVTKLAKFFASKDGANSFYTLGMTDADLTKLQSVQKKTTLKKISIDVANGYIQKFAEVVKFIRKKNPSALLMAGTVVTAEMTKELMCAGADIVRVGIGSGSVCKTRDITGVGMPQLSAVSECADIAHKMAGYVCADGGCRTPGDIAKAFGAGADFVMLGGMLAGHDECVGRWQYKTIRGKRHRMSMTFYGMASERAMKKYYGDIPSYRSSEGITTQIPYRGPVKDTIKEIMAGLRSTMTYIGAERLEKIHENVTFVKICNPRD